MNPIATRLVSSPTHSPAFAAIGLRTALLASCVIGAILPAATISTAQTSTKAVACVPNGLGACQLDPTGVSVEYRHSSGVHFTTACKNEQNAVEAVRNAQGQPEFVRTGQTLSLLPNPLAGVTLPINRYFITLGGVARHFYTLLPGELAVLDQAWATAKPNEACFESASVGNGVAPAGITSTTALPSAAELAAASCPRGTYPIWRAFNDARKTDNTAALPQHRFTSDWEQFQAILATTGANDKWADEGVRLCGKGADQQIRLNLSAPVPPSATETRWTVNFYAQHDGAPTDTPPAQALIPTVTVRLPAGLTYQTATSANAAFNCNAATPSVSGQDVRCTLNTLLPGATSPTYTLWATGPAVATGTTRVSAIAIGTSSATISADEGSRLAPAQCVANSKPSYGCAVAEYVVAPVASYSKLTFTEPVIAGTMAQAGATAITLTATLTNNNTTGTKDLTPTLAVEFLNEAGAWLPLAYLNSPFQPTLPAGSSRDFNVTAMYPASAPRTARLRLCAVKSAFVIAACTGAADGEAISTAVSTTNLPSSQLSPSLSIAGFSWASTPMADAPYPNFSFVVSNALGTSTATGLSCSAETTPIQAGITPPTCQLQNAALAGGESVTCRCVSSGARLTAGQTFAWALVVSGSPGVTSTSQTITVSNPTQTNTTTTAAAELTNVVWGSVTASATAQPNGARLIAFNGVIGNSGGGDVPVTLKLQIQQNGAWIDVTPQWTEPVASPTRYALATGATATVSGNYTHNPVGNESALTLRLCAVQPSSSGFVYNGGYCDDATGKTGKVSSTQQVTFTPPPAVRVQLSALPSLLVGTPQIATATVTPNANVAVTGPLWMMLEAPVNYTMTTAPGANCNAVNASVWRCPLVGAAVSLSNAGVAISFTLTPRPGSGAVSGTLYASATTLDTLNSAQCTGADACASQTVNPAYYDLRATINSVQSTQVTVAGTADATSSNFVLACDNIGNATPPASARCQISIKNGGNVIGQTDFAVATTQTVYIKNSGSGALALCKAQNTSGTVCDPVISNITPQAITLIELKATDVDGFDNNVANNNATASVTVGSAAPPPAPTTCTPDPTAIRLRLYTQAQGDPARYDDVPLRGNTTYYLEMEPGQTRAPFAHQLDIKPLTGDIRPTFSLSKCPGDLTQGPDTPVALSGLNAGLIGMTIGATGTNAGIWLPGIETNTRWYANYNIGPCAGGGCTIAYALGW